MIQRRKAGYMADSRAQWTTMALLGWFSDGGPAWSPEHPHEQLVLLRCQACRAVLGQVLYYDGTASGATAPVYLAEVQTVVSDPEARPVEVAQATLVLSPLSLDLQAIRRLITDPSRVGVLDEARQHHLLDWLARMEELNPSGQIPVTADPIEEVRPVCNVAAHRPKAVTVGKLLAMARKAKAASRMITLRF